MSRFNSYLILNGHYLSFNSSTGSATRPKISLGTSHGTPYFYITVHSVNNTTTKGKEQIPEQPTKAEIFTNYYHSIAGEIFSFEKSKLTNYNHGFKILTNAKEC